MNHLNIIRFESMHRLNDHMFIHNQMFVRLLCQQFNQEFILWTF